MKLLTDYEVTIGKLKQADDFTFTQLQICCGISIYSWADFGRVHLSQIPTTWQGDTLWIIETTKKIWSAHELVMIHCNTVGEGTSTEVVNQNTVGFLALTLFRRSTRYCVDTFWTHPPPSSKKADISQQTQQTQWWSWIYQWKRKRKRKEKESRKRRRRSIQRTTGAVLDL